MEELRVSVRELVEFTLHGADIRLISGRMQDMLDGTLGHQARQKLLGDGWQAEVPLNLPIPVEDEELTLVLGGRMDAFRDAPDVPCVEEIKLWQGEHPPEAPIPAHRMQAVCYGHMLCVTRGLPAVDVRVVYVTRRGKVQGEFPERLTAEECRAEFQSVLLPYLREKVRGGGALAVPVVLLRHDTVAAMPFLAMMAPVGLIVPSVMLPTTYKLGATKGRVVYIVMLMVVAATCAVLMTSESVRGVLTVLPILPVIIITLAIFVGSWALSVKWFKAREL